MTKKRFGIISLAAGLLLALICMFAVMFAAAEDAPVTLEEMIAADAISDENGIHMPSFFGYILWSLCILVPVFLLDTLVFFL